MSAIKCHYRNFNRQGLNIYIYRIDLVMLNQWISAGTSVVYLWSVVELVKTLNLKSKCFELDPLRASMMVKIANHG